MLGIVLVAALSALLLALVLAPVRLSISAHGHGVGLSARVGAAALFWRMEREIDVTAKVRETLEHIVVRWFDTGEPVSVPFQKSLKGFPTGRVMRAVERPLRRLLSRSTCRRLLIGVKIGGRDAMESALLAGLCWSVIGTALGLLAGWVRLPARQQRVVILPDFQQRTLQVEMACILEFRLGQAIGATIWLLSRALSDPEVRAWWRESRRRERGRQDE